MAKDHTIHLWGTDGAHAGRITLLPQGCVDLSIVQVNLQICGLKNFDFWWHKVRHDVMEILEKHPDGLVFEDKTDSTGGSDGV